MRTDWDLSHGRQYRQRPPCVKGAVKIGTSEPILTGGLSFFTIPPSKIKDFCHLPLHKGGLRFALQWSDKRKFETFLPFWGRNFYFPIDILYNCLYYKEKFIPKEAKP
jgi:hypothetical protein